MDLLPTQLPVKSQTMNRRKNEAQKTDVKGRWLLPREKPVFAIARNPSIPPKTANVPPKTAYEKPRCREKRVFGTSRNPNIPLKTAIDKPMKGKPSSRLLEKATKPSQTIRSSPDIQAPIVEAKNPSEKTPARPKKKSVCFQEKEVRRNEKLLDYGNAAEPHTPMDAVVTKPRFVTTPYLSAEKCSKCRFDKLETVSYWLSQIKLAESVGRHSVSAAFFELAYECNAEPVRNLRVELKKYLGRHGHLNEGVEWRKVKVSYGLVEEKSCANGEEEVNQNPKVHSHKEEDLANQIAENS